MLWARFGDGKTFNLDEKRNEFLLNYSIAIPFIYQNEDQNY